MKNQEVRTHAKERKVFFWQLAAELGISEPTMVRRMRFELPEQDKQQYINLIDKIAEENRKEI